MSNKAKALGDSGMCWQSVEYTGLVMSEGKNTGGMVVNYAWQISTDAGSRPPLMKNV